jgi:hypothetical protein
MSFLGEKPVESSNITSIDYDPDLQILKVAFKGGGEFTYNDVPEGEYNSFLNAESKGKHFHANIKGRYQHTKL